MYHQAQCIRDLHSVHTVHLCVLYASQNKLRFLLYKILSDWFLSEFEVLRKATISCIMCVCLSALNSLALTGRILMKFDV